MIKKTIILLCLITSMFMLQGFSDENLFRHDEDVTIEEGTTVNNIVCINGNVTLNGTVKENIVVFNGNLTLGKNADIKGETVIIGGAITKSRTAKTMGGVTTISSDQITKLSHSLKYYEPKKPIFLDFIKPLINISFFILILLTVIFFPKTVGGASFIAETRPWKTLFTGILSSVLIFPIIVLLLISLIGITLIPVFIIALILIILFGTVAIYQLVGKKISGLFRIKDIPILWETLVGIISIYLIGLIPLFCSAITIVIATLGLGAGVLYIAQLRKPKKVD